MTLIPSRGTVFDVEGGFVYERHHLILWCQITTLSSDEALVEISFRQPGIPMNPVWCKLNQLPEQFAQAARQLGPDHIVSDVMTGDFLCSYDAVAGTLEVERIYYGNNPYCFATETAAYLAQ